MHNLSFYPRLRLVLGRAVLAVLAVLLQGGVFSSQAQVSTNATNSTVRFRIAHGSTLVGDVDVELFDSIKPITVSNFLAYVQSGKYSRSLLHRLVPGFVLQGGASTVASPFAPVSFEVTTLIPAFAPITNEFNVGGVLSNVLGTLGMARAGDAPNSATSQWFFNLADNNRGSGSTNLNTSDGGYTVFGRVIAGLSVLQQFNSRALNNGILDTTTPSFRQLCKPIAVAPNGGTGYPFDKLPVAFQNGFGCPNYTDLFTVDVIVLNARDVLPPSIAITTPKENAVVLTPNQVVGGTVTDNIGISSVRLYRGTNEPIEAVVTNGTWTAMVSNLPPGTNSILAEATDTSGLRGQKVVTFFRSVRAPLTLAVTGHGRVRGATNQEYLEIGRGYKLTAVPDPGNLFAGWTGDASGESLTLPFLMASNLSISAVFATNLFPFVKGTFTGLFFDPNQVEQESSGYLTLTLGSSGTYSGKIQMNGKSYPWKGVFSPDGNETNSVPRPGTNGLQVVLSLDLTNGTDQLTGVVTNNQGGAIDTNRSWSAVLLADRAIFHPATNPAPQAARYTFLIPPDPASPAGPLADGFGAVTVSTKGALSFSGMLADGTKVAQKTVISKGGAWPLYVSTSKGTGALVSWLTFSNNPAGDLGGLLNWFRQRQSGVKYYGTGFTNESFVIGTRYVPAVSTNRVLELVNGIVGFTNGNLSADFSNAVTIGADGKVTTADTNRLTLTIAKPTGLFKGSVIPPGSRKAIQFNGAVLQSQNRGAGFFLGTNAAGSVVLGP